MIINLVSNFGTSSSGFGALGISGSSFIIQLITFILAYLVLRRFAFGPITKVLRERRELIEKGVSLGDQMQKDKLKLDSEIEEELAAARVKADKIITEAEESAKQSIREAETKAQTKAESIIEQAKAQTKLDIEAAKRKLESDLVGLVAEATEVLTEEKVDLKKDSSLITKSLYGQNQA